MKMIYTNGGSKRNLEILYNTPLPNTPLPNIQPKLTERQMTSFNLKINMLERLKMENNCSSCGK